MSNLTSVESKAGEMGWTLIAAEQVHSGGNGYVPHGFALIRREHFPFPGREYATLGWYVQSDGAFFESGHYDLTLEDARVDFRKRVA